VYTLVAHRDAAGDWVAVAKKSAAKATIGGRKFAVRTLDHDQATAETIYVGENPVATGAGRPLLAQFVTAGTPDEQFRGAEGTRAAREHRAMSLAELPPDAMRLSRGEPAIPTVYAPRPAT